MNTLLVGPSHVIRIQEAIVEGILPVFRDVTFYGRGGLPIWDANLKDFLSGNHNRYDRICIMVPDFRFGNNVLDAEPGLVGDNFWFRSGFYEIDKDLVGGENDRFLYENCISILDELVTMYGEKLHLMFWCLAAREGRNISEGRYIKEGTYSHPIWNYKYLSERYHKYSVSVREVLEKPYDFTFDKSGHPNIFGFFNILRKFDIWNENDINCFLAGLTGSSTDPHVATYLSILNDEESKRDFELIRSLACLVGVGGYVIHLYFKILISERRFSEVIWFFKYIKSLNRSFPRELEHLVGFAAYSIGDPYFSIDTLESSLEYKKDQVGVLYYLSLSYFEIGNLLKSMMFIEKALCIESKPEFIKHKSNLDRDIAMLKGTSI